MIIKVIKNFIKIFTVFLFFFFFSINFTLAVDSFGISPPYVVNDGLEPGSVYEHKIFIVRRDPSKDLQANIFWDVPGANDWISIDGGENFILPIGEQKIPMTVRVTVPENASPNKYEGLINISVTSLSQGQEQSGMISVGLEAKARVDLQVLASDSENNISGSLLARIPFSGEIFELTLISLLLLLSILVLFFRDWLKNKLLKT